MDTLIARGTVTEQELRDAEARIRKQSNIDVAYIATNPFKLVVNNKSADRDDWAVMNSAQVAKGEKGNQDGCIIHYVQLLNLSSVLISTR